MTEHLLNCPRCGQRILWADGEPSPDLVKGAAGQVVGCGRCETHASAARVRPEDAKPKPPAWMPEQEQSILGKPPGAPDPRPFREKIASEGKAVVDLFSQGLDVVEKAAKFWDTLKGKRT